ncbi:MAG TPA: FecR domain-containing protein [Bradyrhizobium sp.]|nr:FecR domain-containing protein [Bradyrhizobium sp.]
MDGRTTIAAMGLLLAMAGSLSEPARAQDVKPIGKVVTTVGKVTIEHADAAVVQARLSDDQADAKIGDPIYRGDVIKTGADGRVGINFADGSSFNVSSNASMEMNEFVYDPAGKSNSTLFSLAKGTFTFIAGNVAKTGNMKVDTPVATLGIRGTTPHIEISDDGTVRFSTLIEEGKDRVMKRKAAPGAAPVRERKAERELGICRGC